MMLITKELMKKVPKVGANSRGGIEDLKFYVKLFTPWSNWTWYIAEADWETGECFGLVEGFEKELGYFDLNELKEIRGMGGLKIERDRWFSTSTYAEVMEAS